jgi:N-acyl-D-amino-acid deacylase
MTNESSDLLIRGATVYDGTGAAPFRGDVAVRGDRIVAVGESQGKAGVVIDGEGLAVAPGFIDVHSHDDFAVHVVPAMDFKVMQGGPTDVGGHCGMGAAPFEPASLFAKAVHPAHTLRPWEGYAGYMGALAQDPPSLNVALLVGHGTVRAAAMGGAQRAPDPSELDRMREILREGLEAGAVGYSTGLIYEPGRHARTDELVTLAAEMTDVGGLYATHMRDEGAGLLDSVAETIEIGERAGVAVQVSHHKASTRDAWGLVNQSLRLMEEARARGLDVSADQYPYVYSSTILAAIVTAIESGQVERSALGRDAAANVIVVSASNAPDLEGRSLGELCDEWNVDPPTAARRVLEQDGAAWIVMLSMDEEDVRTVLRHPTTMIGSDGIPTDGGKPHPRLYGTFPRVLGHYARKEGVLPVEEAIWRMTGLPATKFRLRDRGFVREGAYADLVVLDVDRVLDRATFEEPRRYPDGIRHVFVNGTAVVRDGEHTHARPGRPLRRD